MRKFVVTRIAQALAALGVATASAQAIAQYTPAEKVPPPPAATVPAAPVANPTTSEEKAKKRAQREAAKPAAAPPAAPEPSPLIPLGWLEGCWRGSAGRREYREQWMPLRGNLMVGVSQTVGGDKTLDFEYLRLEPRTDGIYYVVSPPGQKETAFKLTGVTAEHKDDREDMLFAFANPALEFPQKITYRRATEGWLYAQLDGKVKGTDHQVVYPMRRISCESGEIIPK